MSDYNIESMDLSNESLDYFGFLQNNFNMINESSSYVSPHEDGLEYGHNSADIAGDNMAAHSFASDLNGEYNGLGNINTEDRMVYSFGQAGIYHYYTRGYRTRQ